MHAPLNTQRFFFGRFVLTHIAFKRQTGIGFFESVSGRARSPAEAALVVFLPIDDIFVSAHAFGGSIFTSEYRNPYVFDRMANDPDTRPGRVIAAIFRRCMNERADYLARPAAVTLIGINLDRLDFLRYFSHFLKYLSVPDLRQHNPNLMPANSL